MCTYGLVMIRETGLNANWYSILCVGDQSSYPNIEISAAASSFFITVAQRYHVFRFLTSKVLQVKSSFVVLSTKQSSIVFADFRR